MGKMIRGGPSAWKAGSPGGLELSRRRQKKGISLQQVVDETKITMRYLLAIEAEQFEDLPGGVFALNYLRQYAVASGFDPERLLEYYSDKVNPPDEEKAQPIRPGCAQRSLLDRLFGLAV